MAEEKMSVEELAKDADRAIVEVEALQGKDGEGFAFVTGRNKVYRMLPACLGDIPKINKLLAEYDKIIAGQSITDEAVDAMSAIILYGIKDCHPKATIEDIKRDFALSDYPKSVKAIMSLNDFFQQARETMVMKKVAENTVGK